MESISCSTTHLLLKLFPFCGFVFISPSSELFFLFSFLFSSSSSPSSSSSHSRWNPECTSNSFGATSLLPAGLPQAIEISQLLPISFILDSILKPVSALLGFSPTGPHWVALPSSDSDAWPWAPKESEVVKRAVGRLEILCV